MRIIIVLLLICCISCKRLVSEKRVGEKQETTVQKDTIPNIFVYKRVVYSKDSLPITMDIYEVDSKKPTILLCHQAGFSRGEYKDTAVKLNYMGYSCVAMDQRSGKEANGVPNETTVAAKSRGLPTNYLDAKPDIETVIDFIYEMNGSQPVVLVGSSYSATLALLIGKDTEKVKSIAAFSPGEYYKSLNIKELIKNVAKPIFVTSSKKESPALKELVSLIAEEYLIFYRPEGEGIHGSRALWESTQGHQGYWQAFEEFLKKNMATN